jgi:hypothetical protein
MYKSQRRHVIMEQLTSQLHLTSGDSRNASACFYFSQFIDLRHNSGPNNEIGDGELRDHFQVNRNQAKSDLQAMSIPQGKAQPSYFRPTVRPDSLSSSGGLLTDVSRFAVMVEKGSAATASVLVSRAPSLWQLALSKRTMPVRGLPPILVLRDGELARPVMVVESRRFGVPVMHHSALPASAGNWNAITLQRPEREDGL